MGAAGGEIDDALAASRMHNSRGLGCQDGLQVRLVDEKRFKELSFDHRRGQFNDGLVDEKNGSFRHGANATREAEPSEMLQEVFVEATKRAKIIKIARGERERLEIVQHVRQAGEDKVAAVGRIITEVEAESRAGGTAALPVRLSHRQLIEIREQSQRRLKLSHAFDVAIFVSGDRSPATSSTTVSSSL